MKKRNNTFLLSQHLFFSICWMAGCLFFSQCAEKSSENSGTPGDLRVLIVGGGESHDFDKWYKEVDSQTLRKDGLAQVRYTDNPDSIIHYLQEIDVLYLTNNQPIKDPKTRQVIFDFSDAGNGLVLGHAALWYNWEDWPEFNRQIVSGGSRGHDKYGTLQVNITNTNHPVMKGVDQEFTLKDELYYFKMDEIGPGIEVLATASKEGSEVFPSVFVVKHPKARIVGLALGHDGESHDLEAYRTILRNAVKWVAGK